MFVLFANEHKIGQSGQLLPHPECIRTAFGQIGSPGALCQLLRLQSSGQRVFASRAQSVAQGTPLTL